MINMNKQIVIPVAGVVKNRMAKKMKTWVEDNGQMNHVTVAKNYDETRILWETVFDQDSQAFVSYYYNEIAKYNIQFVITNGERCDGIFAQQPYVCRIAPFLYAMRL